MVATAGEASPIPIEKAFRLIQDDSILDTRVAEFKKHGSLPFAMDLIASALAENKNETALDAAKFVLDGSNQLALPKELARRVLGIDTEFVGNSQFSDTSVELRIKSAKQNFREYQRNPLLALDLARLYTTIGQNNKAGRFIQIALALAPNHRVILRSAARFFLHIHDSEQAHHLLLRSPTTKRDPWLIASEISVASICDKTSNLVRTGLELVKFKRHSDSDLSELASALATLELSGGRSLRAKKLFAQALIAPNENVLAQVEWASKALNLDLEPRSRKVPLAYEANAWGTYRKQNYLGAMDHSMNWLHDEPFSGRAANFGSFVAALQEDFTKSQEFIELGMKANPDDLSLQNNQIFILLARGQYEEAEKKLAVFLHTEKMSEPQTLANFGMLLYAYGDFPVAAQAYEKAAGIAGKDTDKSTESLVRAFHARAAFHSTAPDHEGIYRAALEFATKSQQVDALEVLKRIKPSSDVERRLLELRSKSQRSVTYDRARNILIVEP